MKRLNPLLQFEAKLSFSKLQRKRSDLRWISPLFLNLISIITSFITDEEIAILRLDVKVKDGGRFNVVVVRTKTFAHLTKTPAMYASIYEFCMLKNRGKQCSLF